MNTAVKLKLAIAEPISLKVGVARSVLIGTAQAGPRGEQGNPGGTLAFGWGAKKTGVDAGTLKEVSFDDDYMYVCVVEGTAETTPGANDGTAKWKKTVLFQT